MVFSSARKSIESGDLIEMEGVYGVIKNINSRYTLIEMFRVKKLWFQMMILGP